MAKKAPNTDLVLTSINTKELITFMSKFSLDASCLIEFPDSDTIAIKSTETDRHVVKYGKKEFSDIFKLEEDVELPDNLLIGIYNTSNFKSILNTMSLTGEDVKFIVKYAEETNKVGSGKKAVDMTCNFATSLQLSTSNLTVDIPIGEFSEFGYIQNSDIERMFNNEEYDFKFSISKDSLKQIEQLASMDGTDSITFQPKDVDIYIYGYKFIITAADNVEVNDVNEVGIKNSYLKYLDKTDYEVYGLTNRCLFVSDDDINVVISVLE